jgi:hypothetical protein
MMKTEIDIQYVDLWRLFNYELSDKITIFKKEYDDGTFSVDVLKEYAIEESYDDLTKEDAEQKYQQMIDKYKPEVVKCKSHTLN